ncbi:MAG: 1-acyl-sn-glycerol-3-phosphate acyltransferase, partial [Acidobacteriota bacterium]
GGESALPPAGDAAVVLVLERLEDAERRGRHVYATLAAPPGDAPAAAATLDPGSVEAHGLHQRFGFPFAAAGLLRAALGILGLERGVKPAGERWAAGEERSISIGRTPSVARPEPAPLVFRRGPAAPRRAAGEPAGGPTLHFAAHPPALRLPLVPSSEGSSSMSSSDHPLSAMPPAPALPTVSSSAAFEAPGATAASPPAAPEPSPASAAAPAPDPAPAPAAVQPLPAPAPAAVPRPASAPAGAPHLEAFRRHLDLLGQAQREFMAHQAAAHQSFLDFRQRSAAAFGGLQAGAAPRVQAFEVLEATAPLGAPPPDPALPSAFAGQPAAAASAQALTSGAPAQGGPAAAPPESRVAQSRVPEAVAKSAGPVPEISIPEVSIPEVSIPQVPTPQVPQPEVSAPEVAAASVPPAAPAPAALQADASAQAEIAVDSAEIRRKVADLPPLRPPVGPAYDREQLKIHASGKISDLFGEVFLPQDGFERQVRMPEPPLLLADRVTGLDAEPGSMGHGTVWTETDVAWNSWYLHRGRMPTGVMIESGQADLMLISYVGIDMLNRSERVYRLLGCELTFHGDLPKPGDTLKFQIHLDGHAKQGDVRLMFFRYQCRIDGDPRLTVRSGQAGFFTDQELADSAGVLWRPEEQEIRPDARVDPPAPGLAAEHQPLERSQLEALAAGRPWECFGGEGFDAARSHVRTPAIAPGRMLFVNRVSDLVAGGGPWKRGYLRAERPVTPDDWFFGGHFMNDPCMPGTLMMEGCLQTMAIFMLAMGDGLSRDGWRFQPVTEEPFVLRCRGQVLPSSRHLVYEVFVEERHDGPIPTLYADLLCTVDGLKAFHARRVGLQLVPDYPMDSRAELSAAAGELRPEQIDFLHVHSLGTAPARKALLAAPEASPPAPLAPDGFAFDYRSLLACAWGRPSEAFGSFYSRFDGHRQVARLPGPPYHFISRVLQIEGEMGAMEVGSRVEVEYDIPEDAWFYSERDGLDADPGASRTRPMPYAVLLEAGLQPCGWLASYVGSTVQGSGEADLMFRNLDGTAEVSAELLAGSGPLRTVATIVDISKTASLIVESFEVESYVGDRLVQKMDTVFGFFPPESMENQVGLPVDDLQRAQLEEPGDVAIDLHDASGPWFLPGRPRLAQRKLLMIDRVTGLWPSGGAHGKGRIRAEKDVDPSEWFFKAHFYSDPVQPGSLGIEAMIQLLQVYMLSANLDHGIDAPRFEALQLDQPLTWKYRGQVVPTNRVITTTLDVTETGRDQRGAFALAEASLWVDGKRIYHATSLGMRIVSGAGPREGETVIDPEKESWIGDHRPTYTVPVLPMMSMVDALAAGAPERDGKPVIALRDVRVKGWMTVDRTRTLRTEQRGDFLYLIADAPDPEARDLDASGLDASGPEAQNLDAPGRENPEPESGPGGAAEKANRGPGRGGIVVASARVERGDYPAPPAPLPRVAGGEPAPSPYESGLLFHGPAFQILESMLVSDQGASSILSARSGVPFGALNAGLLDGATHCIPHDQLHRWDDRYDPDKVAFPAWIPQLELYGPAPSDGAVRCEVRPDGFVGTTDFPAFRVQMIGPDGRVWLAMRLVEACFPKGPIGRASALDRRAFLRDRAFIPGLTLSRLADSGERRLSEAEVQESDWLPGTIEHLYGTRDPERIAVLEHFSQQHGGIHAGRIAESLPLNRLEADTHRDEGDGGESAAVAVAPGPVRTSLDLGRVRGYWSQFNERPGPIEDLYFGLLERFARRVVLEDPEGFERLCGRSVLYLANHQVGIESLAFTVLSSGLLEVPTLTLAKVEHQSSWMGRLIALARRYPEARLPREIAFFDRRDGASLSKVLGEIGKKLRANQSSLMVHVEGTRSLRCRQPVENMSGAFVDLALQVGVPVVPVRYVGGLPVEPAAKRLEFPVGMAAQDFYFGAALEPEALGALHYGERRQRVMDAINLLGPPLAEETPNPPDTDFSGAVAMRAVKSGASSVQATLLQVLAEAPEPSAATRRLLAAKDPEEIVGDDPESAWLRDFAAFFRNGPA